MKKVDGDIKTMARVKKINHDLGETGFKGINASQGNSRQ